MLNIHFQELNTPRLRLRRLCMEDLPFYYRLAGSEKVCRYMLWKPHASIEESAASIQKVLRRYETGDSCRWAIAMADTNELIGIIDLLPRDISNGICSFAYMLAESFWNQGYGTEALNAVVDFAFRECGVQILEADHFADNSASGAVMAKAGMVYQRTIFAKYEKDGRKYDAHVYCLPRTHWQKCSKESAIDNS